MLAHHGKVNGARSTGDQLAGRVDSMHTLNHRWWLQLLGVGQVKRSRRVGRHTDVLNRARGRVGCSDDTTVVGRSGMGGGRRSSSRTLQPTPSPAASPDSVFSVTFSVPRSMCEITGRETPARSASTGCESR